MSDFISRAEAARERAAQAADAAARARARRQGDHAPETPAEAQERRLQAEQRIAAVQAELKEALERSRRAHLAAADLDDEKGDAEGAARHRAEAEEDRRKLQQLGD